MRTPANRHGWNELFREHKKKTLAIGGLLVVLLVSYIGQVAGVAGDARNTAGTSGTYTEDNFATSANSLLDTKQSALNSAVYLMENPDDELYQDPAMQDQLTGTLSASTGSTFAEYYYISGEVLAPCENDMRTALQETDKVSEVLDGYFEHGMRMSLSHVQFYAPNAFDAVEEARACVEVQA